eukprot:CAMPEP_0117659752 /NCGR_PEP_ID=MMETSP0804-20121206/6600_1 /TAXON_ID=1074897 /ORGANISM="Tetraselmis astigmatica, Strain CCMP880" /LENGTH=545 /DNA_ID=CAMNT_0005466431 /DNA_START=56 /DNA_END=1694 /DNA_ORIENTATION=-
MDGWCGDLKDYMLSSRQAVVLYHASPIYTPWLFSGEAKAEGEEEAPKGGDAVGGGDGSVPAGVVELPVGEEIEAETNSLPWELQGKLRKRVDIYPRASAVLEEMGYRTGKHRQRSSGKNKKQRGAADTDASTAGEAKIYDVRRDADGTSFDKDAIRLRPEEKKKIDFQGLLYLAPLTTVGNLPFRRVCKALGADITCSEMAMATNLLQGHKSEWALLKRHPCEDLFGIQICGGYPDAIANTAELLEDNLSMDFLDVNCGCPIDLVCHKGAGSALLTKLERLESVVRAGSSVVSCPFTFKTRKGFFDHTNVAHTFVDKAAGWGAAALTLHGRTRAQRYTKRADWDYIERCAKLAKPTGLQIIGNGDVYSYADYARHVEMAAGDDDKEGGGGAGVATCMIARGALIKPWIFTEIKERRSWDISASERLELLKQFCNAGLEHWGSDSKGVEATRRFLMEWLSFLCRYVPEGLLEVVPPKLHWRPPAFVGRSDLETLLCSDSAADWVRISEMLLGPAPPGFSFAPKHKSNAYSAASEAGMALEEATENG